MLEERTMLSSKGFWSHFSLTIKLNNLSMGIVVELWGTKKLLSYMHLTLEHSWNFFYSLSNEITKSLSRLGDAPSTQCAAVRTWFLLMIHPPQRWVPRLLNEICHGNSSKNEYSTCQIKGVSNSQRTISDVDTHLGLVGHIKAITK